MSKIRPFLIIFCLFTITWQSMAQPNECADLVERAILALEDNCDSLDRNSACYGYNAVSAVFSQVVPTDYFTRPADKAGLLDLLSIQTAPLDVDTDRWGIAVMSMQANLPNTLPGQAVTVLLLGDSMVENRVNPSDVAPIATPVEVTITSASDARTSPSDASNTVGRVRVGDFLFADALNSDGTWLRVVVDDMPAWIRRDDTDSPNGLADLPVITSPIQSPMQAFYFTTGVGNINCAEAPNTITIKSPENLTVDLSVNGVDIRIGSTITLRNSAQNELAFTVQEGHLETSTGEFIEAGDTLIAQTDDFGNIVYWQESRPATETEIGFGDVANRALGAVLDEEIAPLPRPESTETAETTPNTPLEELIHEVVRGDTLFSIARQYDASMPAIVRRNNLADPRNIFVGQRLVIPNPYTGFVGLDDTTLPPQQTPPPVNDVVTDGVDCSNFMPTSPLQGMMLGNNTFQWTSAPGATSYRVIVTNLTEGRSVAFDAPAPLLSLVGFVDQSTVGGGFDFAWRVQALLNGVVMCDSGDRVMQRGGVRYLTVTWACVAPNTVVITYSGVLPEDTITAQFYNPITAQYEKQTGRGQSGTLTFPNMTGGAYLGLAFTSSGEQVALTPDPLLACP
ncbi:MAG: LysM peptidoglycan-binding domain-containing protein [Anaerolineae bacterium]|nr:LysM peptidoglycan-binding domain-containing protein [Anaerolineae bacterium]